MSIREIVQITTWVLASIGFIMAAWVIADSCLEALEARDALERERQLRETEINNELEKKHET